MPRDHGRHYIALGIKFSKSITLFISDISVTGFAFLGYPFHMDSRRFYKFLAHIPWPQFPVLPVRLNSLYMWQVWKSWEINASW